MSKRSTGTRTYPLATEAKCPDCKMTLAFRGELERHRRTQHPADGIVVKRHCPYPGCEYKADQRSNLMAHIHARHSKHRYPCPDCTKGFTDPASRIRHRKTAHGYQPYHTSRYYDRRGLKEAEKQANAALKKTSDQKAANIFPPSTQSASSSSSSSADSLSSLLTDTAYNNDVWKQLVDVPRRDASQPNVSQDVQISAPVAAAPARDTPKTLRSDSGLSLPKVCHQLAPTRTGSQLYTIEQPQSQPLGHWQSWAASYGHRGGIGSSPLPSHQVFGQKR